MKVLKRIIGKKKIHNHIDDFPDTPISRGKQSRARLVYMPRRSGKRLIDRKKSSLLIRGSQASAIIGKKISFPNPSSYPPTPSFFR